MTASPRARAAELLGRVLRSGAYSNVLLGSLEGSPDDRLIRRLVYGTLRQLAAVDAVLTRASNRPLSDIESRILDILRIGAWELRFGDGPEHAAVDEAVEAVRHGKEQSAAGFVNALLRAVQRDTFDEFPDHVRLGVPEWLLDRLRAAWGRPEAEAFLEASLQPAGRTVRLRPGASGGTPVRGIATAARVDRPEDGMVVMDPSSVAVGLAAALDPGMTVLDMAAAPGGKTLHLFDQLSAGPRGLQGMLVASDRHQRRVRSARERLRRQGAEIPWLVGDGRRLPFPAGTFDRVLLDAPCTGLGTLRRRPEIRHRVGPDDPRRLAVVQGDMLEEARRVVRPGGFVVYAVCTVLPEETVETVAELPAAPPEGLPGRPAGTGWLLAPHLTGSDGMFISLVAP